MNAAELIEQLKAMPPDAPVQCLWDGALRSDVQVVYLARGGSVALAEYDSVAYYNDDRPADAPDEDLRWCTPRDPNPNKPSEEDDE